MSVYRLPALDKAAPIVEPGTGRITPYFQRFWQNLSFTAVDGANQSSDVAGLQAQVTAINGQITTINSTLSGKAGLASPAFTGNPTAPTPTAGDNDTSIATTAFVQTAAGARVAKSTFTAWSAATGTAERSTFATYTAPTVSATYDQAEVQALANHVQTLSRRLKALIDDLKT